MGDLGRRHQPGDRQPNNYEFETCWGTLLDPLTAERHSWESPPPGKYPAATTAPAAAASARCTPSRGTRRAWCPTILATTLPDGTTSPTPMRVVPDVSALADPWTGMLVGETTLQPDGTTYTFSLSRIGGTSVACPMFAGIEADAQQAAGTRSASPTRRSTGWTARPPSTT